MISGSRDILIILNHIIDFLRNFKNSHLENNKKKNRLRPLFGSSTQWNEKKEHSIIVHLLNCAHLIIHGLITFMLVGFYLKSVNILLTGKLFVL